MSSTTFSYAQAAKGRSAIQPSPQPSPSPAPPSISSQGKDDATTATNSVTAPSITSNDSDVRDTGKPAQSEGESSLTQHNPDAEHAGEAMHATSDSAAEPMAHALPNGDSASIELAQNPPRSASQASRSADGDARKGRKGKKSKNSDKDNDTDKDQEEDKEEEPSRPVLLSEAPIPSVNIWQKRIELQATKVKVVPTTGSSAVAVAGDATSEPQRRRSSINEAIDNSRAPQTGASGEKPQRKSADFSRTADQQPRRNGPRGTRAADSLPLVSDAALWPDPKSAAATEDGRRRPQDKADRLEKEVMDETNPIKRQKEKWVAMPYVPTVNFQTPIPQRGSKPRGGARGGRDAGARGAHSSAMAAGNAPAISPADKAPATAGAAVAKEGRAREGSGPALAPSLPPNASKRASTDPSYAREFRKPSAPAGAERPRDSTAAFTTSMNGKAENTRPSRAEFAPGNSEVPQYSTRSNFTDRRADPSLKFDGLKEGGPPAVKDQTYPVRERAERGRGGFRGRGGHNNAVGGHPSLSGFPPSGQYAVQGLPGPQHGPYSPPAHQNSFGGGFNTGPARGGGRGNGRTNSGSAGFSRGASNGAGPSSKLGHVNTNNLGGPDYNMNPFSAYGFPAPFYDPGIIQVLMSQVEYYLSVDNLCKDFFIRKRMDSKGFVPLSVIANFNRMRDLAPDMDNIRVACETSENIDYIVGDDHVERLRLRNKWDTFVLSMEEREEEARNDGPAQWVWKSRHSSRPPYSGPMMMPGYMATSPTIYPANFPPEDQMYQPPYMNGAHYEPGLNGGDANGHRYGMDSQLSAAVPEFSPSGPGPFTLETVTTFSDKQVEDLNVLVDHGKKDPPSTADSPAHHAGPVNNGAVNTSDHAQSNGIAPSPGTESSPAAQQGDAIEARSPASPHPNVIWAEQHEGEASAPETEPYTVFRRKALDQRQFTTAGETPRDMKNLYKFWSHFLIGKFNAKMYEEFRTCAIADASKGNPSKDGLRCLIRYYKQLFSHDSPKPWGRDRPIPEIFTLHYQGALMLDPNMSTNGDAGM